jgi:multidrug efflux pump subunit AcrB
MGVTLNIIVLFSLTLAMGMLVDNSVVIIENIYRFMEQGMDRVEAARKATAEVAMPVIGSTITTVAAFLPLLFWPGIMGEFMGYLPLTLIITLLASLFVALVIHPALASLFMKRNNNDDNDGKNCSETDNRTTAGKPVEIKGGILVGYGKILNFALLHPIALIGGSAFLLIFMVQGWLLVVGIEKPVMFFPDIEPRGIFINVDPPEGASLDYIDGIIRQVEMAVAGVKWQHGESIEEQYTNAMALQKRRGGMGDIFIGPGDLKNIETIYTAAVSSAGSSSPFAGHTPNYVGVRFLDMEDQFRSTRVTVDEIRERIKDIVGAKITIDLEEEGPPTGSPINIEIVGDDFAVLGTIAGKIKKELAKLPHVEDIRDDFVEGTPTVRVNVDRHRAALFGLTTDMIGSALKNAYNGLQISSFRDGDEDYDITVQLSEENREVIDVLHELMILTPSGVMVPLSTITTVEFAGSIGSINRINHERVVTVEANVNETITSGAVVRQQAEKLLAGIVLPPGYRISFTGEQQEQEDSEKFLGKAFIIALSLIFLVLVVQFNSMSQPFIIMTSVLLSLGGVFLGLMIYQQPFGVIMTGVGVISLAGIVTKNAIVLVDYTNQLRARGIVLKEAVISAGATRLRPVILTAVTTILGLIPMVTGVSFDFHNMRMSWLSESTQWWSSMAVAVIFGLLVATFLTLIVIPTLYFLLEQGREKISSASNWLGKKRWELYPLVSGER